MNLEKVAIILALILLIIQVAYAKLPPNKTFTVDTLPLELIQLPSGFEIDLYYKGQLPGIRELVLGPSSSNKTIVFASSAAAGSITALFDDNNDGTADRICTLYTNPGSLTNGMAYDEIRDRLYVAQMQQIVMLSNAGAAAKADCDASKLKNRTLYSIPPPANSDADHGRRSMVLTPDRLLYFSIAGPDNVQECTPPLCSVYSINTTSILYADTTYPRPELYGQGLRNTAGLTIDPRTGNVWATVMAREDLWVGNSTDLDGGVPFSDNAPDDVVYAFSTPGLNYQFPYCHWVGYGDPEERSPGSGYIVVDDTVVPPWPGYEAPSIKTLSVWNESLSPYCIDNVLQKPSQALGPHVSPIGLGFYEIPSVDGGSSQSSGSQIWPTEWRDGGLYVAEHGSWNRRIAIGYRVAFLKTTSDGQVLEHTPFATGWLQGDAEGDQWRWGRPVGIMTLPDGSMLVSDDDSGLGGGAIYRIRYTGGKHALRSGAAFSSAVDIVWLYLMLIIGVYYEL